MMVEDEPICWMCCDFADGKDATVLSLFSMQARDTRPFHIDCWKIYCSDIRGIVGEKALEDLSRYVDTKELNYKNRLEELENERRR
jgi:hypothetical protein